MSFRDSSAALGLLLSAILALSLALPPQAPSIELGAPLGDDNEDEESNNIEPLEMLSEGSGPQLAQMIAQTQLGSLLVPVAAAQPKSRNEIYLLEDKDYPRSLFEDYSKRVGQVSGLTALPSGDVAIFHRAGRQWTPSTFNESSQSIPLAEQENLIRNDTIMILDRELGNSVSSLGSNLFYMPHGIASDPRGNLWVTDVGRHQVMRLPTSMMRLGPADQQTGRKHRWLPGNFTRLWPDVILGEAFVPGSDSSHFCKPSEVAVSSDGRLVYVADGYCNRRLVAFAGDSGQFIKSFGEWLQMEVVHSLALIEERNLLCAADRENGRIHCFRAGLDGDLASLGQLVHSVDYPIGQVFALAPLSADHLLVSSAQPGSTRYDLAILNPFSFELKLVWTSSDLLEPHSLARTRDGQYVYAADLSKEAFKKVFKFNIIQRHL